MIPKLDYMKKHLEIVKSEDNAESETITLSYVSYLEKHIKLLEEGYKAGIDREIAWRKMQEDD